MKLNILPEETEAVLKFIKSEFDEKLDSPNISKNKIPRIKDADKSTECRKKGNDLFNSQFHDDKIHETIWILYTKSIALAPNNSEELALAYGNRSAFLYHLKKYLECIINCDKALFVTKSDVLILKLLYRKALSLLYINEHSEVKETCAKAKQLLKSSSIQKSIRKEYKGKFSSILSNCLSMSIDSTVKDSNYKKQYCEQLSNFKRQEEVPCASQSVTIKYNEKYGRHIIATQDIFPGEIIAIEENFCTLTNLKGKYSSCSYCNQFTWLSFPCEHCVDDVYCSKNCQQDAWVQYHCFECSLYPNYFKDVLEESKYNDPFFLRLFLKIFYKVGNFESIIGILFSIQKCPNLRKKGFERDVFDAHSVKSFFSLSSKPLESIETKVLYEQLHMVCRLIFLLAQKTTFFGENYKSFTIIKLINEPQIVFAAIVFLKILLVVPYNAHLLLGQYQGELSIYGSCIGTFKNLFNHSCDANVESFVGKNNKTILYAKHPIKKGSQLFLCYLDREDLFQTTKKERREYLLNYYDFKCKCTLCKNNESYSPYSIMEEKDKARYMYTKFPNFIMTLRNIESGKCVEYNPDIMNNIKLDLEWLAEEFGVYCKEYTVFAKCLKDLLQDVFGSYNFKFMKECDYTTEFYS